MLAHDVVIWSIRNRKGRAKPYQLRWKVGTEPKSKAFLTKALADNYRADLLQAAKKGEHFDTEAGLLISMMAMDANEPPMSWYDSTRSSPSC